MGACADDGRAIHQATQYLCDDAGLPSTPCLKGNTLCRCHAGGPSGSQMCLCKVRYYRLADDVPQQADSLVEAEPGALDAGVPTSAIALLPHGCSRDRSALQVMPFSLASGWTPHPCLPGTLLAVKLLPQPLEATRHDSTGSQLSTSWHHARPRMSHACIVTDRLYMHVTGKVWLSPLPQFSSTPRRARKGPCGLHHSYAH